MHTHRLSQSPSSHVVAFAAAVLCTAVQLAAVVALAHTPAPAGVQLVELERVVVTGKRVAATTEAPQQLAGVCESREPQRC